MNESKYVLLGLGGHAFGTIMFSLIYTWNHNWLYAGIVVFLIIGCGCGVYSWRKLNENIGE